jgi:DNA-binding response OmpR family regulator
MAWKTRIRGDGNRVVIASHDPRVLHHQAALEGGGYVVEVAHDEVEALDSVQRLHPAVLLVDLDLPQGEGWAILLDLMHPAEAPQRPQVIAVSADHDCVRDGSLAAEACFTKPLRVAELLDCCRTAVRRAAQSRA